MEYRVADRAGTHYIEIGYTGHVKPVLVMLHGFGGGAAMFARAFKPLAKYFHIYALDLWGCGLSERPPFQLDHTVCVRVCVYAHGDECMHGDVRMYAWR